MRTARHHLLLLLAAALAAGEPLVCRGFDAGSAVRAVASTGGRLLVLDQGLEDRRLWFALADDGPAAARQALAHALGCWWSDGQITGHNRLASGDASVRIFPPLPSAPPGAEDLLRRLLDPWLAGAGGLAVDPASGAWTVTATPAGLARLEQLLTALADPAPRAPHLLPQAAPDRPLARPPQGADLGAWSLDLARCAGVAVALGPDCDPSAAPPTGRPTTLTEAVAALAGSGLSAAIEHGCLCIGLARPGDRQHPALRASVAILPVGHLCRGADELSRLATQLGARVEPRAWDQPGYAIAPLPWRMALLVVADPATIHAVMTALEAADQTGLATWLR